MQLDIHPDAAKFVGDLDPKRFKQVLSKILALLKDPEPQDSQKLRGYSFYRVDSGEYRIIYARTDEVITILIVGKRNDDEVYKELNRNFKPDET
jgi:mRNA interferase RelE/StbE